MSKPTSSYLPMILSDLELPPADRARLLPERVASRWTTLLGTQRLVARGSWMGRLSDRVRWCAGFGPTHATVQGLVEAALRAMTVADLVTLSLDQRQALVRARLPGLDSDALVRLLDQARTEQGQISAEHAPDLSRWIGVENLESLSLLKAAPLPGWSPATLDELLRFAPWNAPSSWESAFELVAMLERPEVQTDPALPWIHQPMGSIEPLREALGWVLRFDADLAQIEAEADQRVRAERKAEWLRHQSRMLAQQLSEKEPGESLLMWIGARSSEMQIPVPELEKTLQDFTQLLDTSHWLQDMAQPVARALKPVLEQWAASAEQSDTSSAERFQESVRKALAQALGEFLASRLLHTAEQRGWAGHAGAWLLDKLSRAAARDLLPLASSLSQALLGGSNPQRLRALHEAATRGSLEQALIERLPNPGKLLQGFKTTLLQTAQSLLDQLPPLIVKATQAFLGFQIHLDNQPLLLQIVPQADGLMRVRLFAQGAAATSWRTRGLALDSIPYMEWRDVPRGAINEEFLLALQRHRADYRPGPRDPAAHSLLTEWLLKQLGPVAPGQEAEHLLPPPKTSWAMLLAHMQIETGVPASLRQEQLRRTFHLLLERFIGTLQRDATALEAARPVLCTLLTRLCQQQIAAPADRRDDAALQRWFATLWDLSQRQPPAALHSNLPEGLTPALVETFRSVLPGLTQRDRDLAADFLQAILGDRSSELISAVLDQLVIEQATLSDVARAGVSPGFWARRVFSIAPMVLYATTGLFPQDLRQPGLMGWVRIARSVVKVSGMILGAYTIGWSSLALTCAWWVVAPVAHSALSALGQWFVPESVKNLGRRARRALMSWAANRLLGTEQVTQLRQSWDEHLSAFTRTKPLDFTLPVFEGGEEHRPALRERVAVLPLAQVAPPVIPVRRPALAGSSQPIAPPEDVGPPRGVGPPFDRWLAQRTPLEACAELLQAVPRSEDFARMAEVPRPARAVIPPPLDFDTESQDAALRDYFQQLLMATRHLPQPSRVEESYWHQLGHEDIPQTLKILHALVAHLARVEACGELGISGAGLQLSDRSLSESIVLQFKLYAIADLLARRLPDSQFGAFSTTPWILGAWAESFGFDYRPTQSSGYFKPASPVCQLLCSRTVQELEAIFVYFDIDPERPAELFDQQSRVQEAGEHTLFFLPPRKRLGLWSVGLGSVAEQHYLTQLIRSDAERLRQDLQPLLPELDVDNLSELELAEHIYKQETLLPQGYRHLRACYDMALQSMVLAGVQRSKPKYRLRIRTFADRLNDLTGKGTLHTWDFHKVGFLRKMRLGRSAKSTDGLVRGWLKDQPRQAVLPSLPANSKPIGSNRYQAARPMGGFGLWFKLRHAPRIHSHAVMQTSSVVPRPPLSLVRRLLDFDRGNNATEQSAQATWDPQQRKLIALTHVQPADEWARTLAFYRLQQSELPLGYHQGYFDDRLLWLQWELSHTTRLYRQLCGTPPLAQILAEFVGELADSWLKVLSAKRHEERLAEGRRETALVLRGQHLLDLILHAQLIVQAALGPSEVTRQLAAALDKCIGATYPNRPVSAANWRLFALTSHSPEEATDEHLLSILEASLDWSLGWANEAGVPIHKSHLHPIWENDRAAQRGWGQVGFDLHPTRVADQRERRLMWSQLLIDRLNADPVFRNQALSELARRAAERVGQPAPRGTLQWEGQYPLFLSGGLRVRCGFEPHFFGIGFTWLRFERSADPRHFLEAILGTFIPSVMESNGFDLPLCGSLRHPPESRFFYAARFNHQVVIEQIPDQPFRAYWRDSFSGLIYRSEPLLEPCQGHSVHWTALSPEGEPLAQTMVTRAGRVLRNPLAGDPAHPEDVALVSNSVILPSLPEGLAALQWFAPAEAIAVRRAPEDPAEILSIRISERPAAQSLDQGRASWALNFKIERRAEGRAALLELDPSWELAIDQRPEAMRSALKSYPSALLLNSTSGAFQMVLDRRQLLTAATHQGLRWMLGLMAPSIAGLQREESPLCPDWVELLARRALVTLSGHVPFSPLTGIMRISIDPAGNLQAEDPADLAWLVAYHLLRGEPVWARSCLRALELRLQEARYCPELHGWEQVILLSALVTQDPEWQQIALRLAAAVEQSNALNRSLSEESPDQQGRSFVHGLLLQGFLTGLEPPSGWEDPAAAPQLTLLRGAAQAMQSVLEKTFQSERLEQLMQGLEAPLSVIARHALMLPSLSARLDRLESLVRHPANRTSDVSISLRSRALLRVFARLISSSGASEPLIALRRSSSSGPSELGGWVSSLIGWLDRSVVDASAEWVFAPDWSRSLSLQSWVDVPTAPEQFQEINPSNFLAYYRLAFGKAPAGLSAGENERFRQKAQEFSCTLQMAGAWIRQYSICSAMELLKALQRGAEGGIEHPLDPSAAEAALQAYTEAIPGQAPSVSVALSEVDAFGSSPETSSQKAAKSSLKQWFDALRTMEEEFRVQSRRRQLMESAAQAGMQFVSKGWLSRLFDLFMRFSGLGAAIGTVNHAHSTGRALLRAFEEVAAADALMQAEGTTFAAWSQRAETILDGELAQRLQQTDQDLQRLFESVVLLPEGQAEPAALAAPPLAAEGLELQHPEPVVQRALSKVNQSLGEYRQRPVNQRVRAPLSCEALQRLERSASVLLEESLKPTLQAFEASIISLLQSQSAATASSTPSARIADALKGRYRDDRVLSPKDWKDLLQAFAGEQEDQFVRQRGAPEQILPQLRSLLYRYLQLSIRQRQLAQALLQAQCLMQPLKQRAVATEEDQIRWIKLVEHLAQPTPFRFGHVSERFLRTSMVFEFVQGCRLRERQVDQLERALQSNDQRLVLQLQTGVGKTFYVGPEINLVLSDGRTSLLNVFPAALTPTCSRQLRESLDRVAGRRCFSIACSRGASPDVSQLRALIQLLEVSIALREPLTARREDLQALELVFLEKLRELGSHKAERAAKERESLELYRTLLRMVRASVKLNADEAQEIFRRRDELNHPLGTEAQLPKEIVEVCLRSIWLLFSDPSLLRLLPGASSDQACFNLEDYLFHGARRMAQLLGREFAVPRGCEQELYAYLADPAVAPPEWVERHPQRQLIALTRGLLTVLLPDCLSAPVDVAYGLSDSAGGEGHPAALGEIAIPFQGNRKPLVGSRIKNPLEELLKTAIAFARQKLDASQVARLLQAGLRAADKTSKALGIPPELTAPGKALQEWLGLELLECGLAAKQPWPEIVERINNQPAAVLSFVEWVVSPHMHHYPESLRSDAQNFASMFQSFVAFTATPEHEGTFPIDTAVLEDPGTLGDTVDLLLTHCQSPRHLQPLAAHDPQQRLDEIIDRFLTPGSLVAMIVDGGALLQGLSGPEVARHLLSRIRPLRPEIRGIIFHDEADELRIMEDLDGTSRPFTQTNLPPQQLHTITYVGHFYRTGTNVLQPSGSEAVVLLGETSTLEDAVQSVGRLRGMRSDGQRPIVVLPQTTLQRIEQQSGCTMRSVLEFLRVNEAEEKAHESFLAAFQKMNNLVRRCVLDAILQVETPEESQRLMRDYASFFVSTMELDPWALFGADRVKGDPLPALQVHAESLWKQIREDTRLPAEARNTVRLGLSRCLEAAPLVLLKEEEGAALTARAQMGLGQSETVAEAVSISQQLQQDQRGQQALQQQQHLQQQLRQQLNQQIEGSEPVAAKVRDELQLWPNADSAEYRFRLGWLLRPEPQQDPEGLVSFVRVSSALQELWGERAGARFGHRMFWSSNFLGRFDSGYVAPPFLPSQMPLSHLLLLQARNREGQLCSFSVALSPEEYAVIWLPYLRSAHQIDPDPGLVKIGVYDLVHHKIMATVQGDALTEHDISADPLLVTDLGRWQFLSGYTTLYRGRDMAMRVLMLQRMKEWVGDSADELIALYARIRKHQAWEPFAESQLEGLLVSVKESNTFALPPEQRFG